MKGGSLFWLIGAGVVIYLIATNETSIAFWWHRMVEIMRGFVDGILGRH
jgi:hypothetical protein